MEGRKSRETWIRAMIAEGDLIQGHADKEGNRWHKFESDVGEHGRDGLEEFRDPGEVRVKEIDSIYFKSFEESGEKFCRVWLKLNQIEMDDLF